MALPLVDVRSPLLIDFGRSGLLSVIARFRQLRGVRDWRHVVGSLSFFKSAANRESLRKFFSSGSIFMKIKPPSCWA